MRFGSEGGIGECSAQTHQHPVAVDGRVPIEAAVEGRSQLARRPGVAIRIEDMVAGLIWIFAMDAGQSQVGESFSGGGVQSQFAQLNRTDRSVSSKVGWT